MLVLGRRVSESIKKLITYVTFAKFSVLSACGLKMAIPFTPNEDTDEYYRVLAQLLRDVLEVLNLLVRRPPPPPPRNRSAPVVNRTEDRSAPLPDLVQCTMTSVERLGAATTIAERLQDPYYPLPRPRPCADVVPPTPAPRRTYRTRRRHIRNTSRSENWAQVGEDLKMIADAFTDTTREAQTSTEDDDDKKQQESLLSLLMPPPFSSSVWTAVIFFVGWRLLSGRGR